MVTASPDDQSEVSLTASLQPAAQISADYSEQSMLVYSLLVLFLRLHKVPLQCFFAKRHIISLLIIIIIIIIITTIINIMIRIIINVVSHWLTSTLAVLDMFSAKYAKLN